MWNDFELALKKMFAFCSGKTIVLWGYGKGGWFIEHLFNRANKQIEYFVDDNPNIRAHESYFIRTLAPEQTVVLLTFSPDNSVDEYLQSLGYKEGESYYYIKNWFFENGCKNYMSYEIWLEDHYDIDIVKKLAKGVTLVSNDAHTYSAGVDYALEKVFDNFEFTPDDAVFDFGCGKGGALLMLLKAGIKKYGGVEYDEMLYNILINNFKKLHLDTNTLIHGDAAEVTFELDAYNYFFFYDPFEGELFSKVISNIEESFMRKKRKIILIYAAAFCDSRVRKNNMFKLCKQIETDYWTLPDVNIYMLG